MISNQRRRQFLQYLLSGGVGTVAAGWLFPEISQSLEANLEELCSSFPENSRCKDYLPGVSARDGQKALAADALLATAAAGKPVPVSGLASQDPVYLVINQGPKIAKYAVRPVCTHLGCTVAWQAERNQFVCPCHGSQFDAQGRVVQGPAKRALPLATVIVKQNQIRLVEVAPAIDPR
jgi:cytochrome b6-f complex iron-sulfur subunit